MLSVNVDTMIVFCFKQKTAYELRISDWSSDLCSSDLPSEIRSLGEMQQEPHVAVQGDRADMRPAGLVHRNDPIDASNTSAQSLTPRGAIHVISRPGRAYRNAARAAASSPSASLSTARIKDVRPCGSRI